MKILLLEDDLEYQESVSEYLTSLGYEVECASDGSSACDKIANGFYHLFILDVKVPNVNGFEVIKFIKNIGLETPIMMMTSLVDINDMAIGYELGCNEYLKKPFELAELKFRVSELMRKYYNLDDKNVIKLSQDYEFNTTRRTLQINGRVINLSAKELELVEYLALNIGKFISVAELKEKIWENKEINEADIRMHVLKIRQKTSNEFIASRRHFGYKIDAKD
ncbi:response regulator [Campylobacter mucosalis]|uniref:response regulator n=1 Tax=Campylobacter mucosalis TaxID=202 RepID=UPI0014704B71